MQSTPQVTIPHTIESAGVDWITATAKTPEGKTGLFEVASLERRHMVETGVEFEQSVRLGYAGWQGRGFFFGHRQDSYMVVASGGEATRLFPLLSKTADKITRLDVQVTVELLDGPANLAQQGDAMLKRDFPTRVKPQHFTLITSHPWGASLNVNKRISDTYARLYDKASEEGLGTPATRWRYEVELKRGAARDIATYLNCAEHLPSAATHVVHGWFNTRGVTPIFAKPRQSEALSPTRSRPDRNVLNWFEDSLSKTVSRAVSHYGLPRVLSSLGLDNHINDFAAQRRVMHADTGQPIRLELDDVDSRSELPQ